MLDISILYYFFISNNYLIKTSTCFQISFLLPVDTVPGRMGFLLTLVLCKINLLNTTVVNSPRSGGQPTAIVQWILFCLFFTTMAIFEYAMILTYKKYRKPTYVLGKSMYGPKDENKMGELFKVSQTQKSNMKILRYFSPVCYRSVC